MLVELTRKFGFMVAASGLMLAIAACGSAPSAEYQIIAKSDFNHGDSIPAPTEPVVLTLSGNLSVKNVGDTLQFDMPTLERLGLVEYTVNDPYLFEDVSYTGILLSELGKFSGASSSAIAFHVVALDDYAVDISAADAEKWPILLATRTDGAYMNVENSGPTRIVFPYDSHPEIDKLAYKDLWIWSLDTIEIN